MNKPPSGGGDLRPRRRSADLIFCQFLGGIADVPERTLLIIEYSWRSYSPGSVHRASDVHRRAGLLLPVIAVGRGVRRLFLVLPAFVARLFFRFINRSRSRLFCDFFILNPPV